MVFGCDAEVLDGGDLVALKKENVSMSSLRHLFFSGDRCWGRCTSEVELALVEWVDVGEGGVD